MIAPHVLHTDTSTIRRTPVMMPHHCCVRITNTNQVSGHAKFVYVYAPKQILITHWRMVVGLLTGGSRLRVGGGTTLESPRMQDFVRILLYRSVEQQTEYSYQTI